MHPLVPWLRSILFHHSPNVNSAKIKKPKKDREEVVYGKRFNSSKYTIVATMIEDEGRMLGTLSDSQLLLIIQFSWLQQEAHK